eukprot:25741-Pelagomonas_calceolata.AAC.2
MEDESALLWQRRFMGNGQVMASIAVNGICKQHHQLHASNAISGTCKQCHQWYMQAIPSVACTQF